LTLLLLGPLSLLIVIGETRQGRIAGWLAFLLLLTAICLASWTWTGYRQKSLLIGFVGVFVVSMGLGIKLFRLAMNSVANHQSEIVSVTLGAREMIEPGLWGIVPEIDLVKLGAAIGTRIIPGISVEHASRIRHDTLKRYQEIEGNDQPSVIHLGVREILGQPFDPGHYFAYVPKRKIDERLGAIVFLHGNGGNFKILPQFWKTFADQNHVAILCPTFGEGFWGDGAAESVTRALDDFVERFSIDRTKVDLLGHSDGGNGVTRVGRAYPDRFRSLIYVSPTMRVDELGSIDFVKSWRGRQVLVLQGDRDINVPKAEVDPAVRLLKASGVSVHYEIYPGEDHYLLFGRSREIFERLGDWLNDRKGFNFR
jgi:pimeloyl-ACP methyl ester carboxylesterase